MYKMYGVKTHELGEKKETNQCVRKLHILQ